MSEKIKIVELYQTCSACPSQWEGKTDKGENIYIRYRHSYLEFNVGVDFTGSPEKWNFGRNVLSRDLISSGYSMGELMEEDMKKELEKVAEFV